MVDTTSEPASRVQEAAFYALRDIRPGQSIEVLTAEDPALLMRSLDLQLGPKLAWSTARDGPLWRTIVRHRQDAPPVDVLDLLQREHRRLDTLLAGAMRLLNGGDTRGAAPVLQTFTRDLARHLQIEDDVIAPVLGTGADSSAAVSTMLREHGEITAQLQLVNDALRSSENAGEAGAYCAILSGTLAKHEHREEQIVFPLWRGALARRGAEEGAALLDRVTTLLGEAPSTGAAG